jgi:hypothetical protein
VKAAIVVFWITMMGLLVYREVEKGRGGPLSEALTEADLAADEGWYGIYFVKEENGQEQTTKIGYSHHTRRNTNPGYLLTEETRLRLVVQGSPKTIRTKTHAAVDAEYRLISFDFELVSDMLKFRLGGQVRGKVLDLSVETGAGTRKETVPITEAASIPINLTDRLAAQGFAVGKTFRVDYFDPSTMAMDQVEIHVIGREKSPIAGAERDVFRVRTAFKGMPIETWVDASGVVLKERTASMMTLREPKNDALSRGWSATVPMDLVDMASIRVAKPIADARRASQVVVRLSGADLTDLPLTDARQTFTDGTLTVGLGPVPASGYPIPYAGGDFAEFLKETPTLQSGDPEILKQARKIAGKDTDAAVVARKLHAWVFKTLTKESIVSIPSAADVLEIKRGDCNEHAALLTALARAVGIPAKIVVGLVYNDGAFYYHAWNALYVGQWVAVDATFGQFPADATHLKVQEGDLDRQVVIARLIGQLKIEVVEAR